MGSLHIGTYFSRENFDKMVAFCTKLALNCSLCFMNYNISLPLFTFHLWLRKIWLVALYKNMAFIPKFHCGIGTFTLSKIRNTRKNSGRKIKNKSDFVRSIIRIISFFFGRKDCSPFFVPRQRGVIVPRCGFPHRPNTCVL